MGKSSKKRTRSKSSKRNSKRSKNIARVAKSVIRSTLETKVHNLLTDSESISSATAAYIYDLSRVPSGNQDHQRIGDKISGFRVSLKWLLRATTAALNGSGYLRVVLYAAEFGQYNDATDTFLLDTSNEPLAPVADNLDDIVAPLNKKGFSVFHDKVYQYGNTDSTTRDPIKTGMISVKLNTIQQYASDTTGDSRKNNIRLLVIQRGVTTASASGGTFTFRSRFFYKDV